MQMVDLPIGLIPVPTGFAGEYRRQHFVGLATSGTIGDVGGVWAELAYGGAGAF